jgi:Uma2 family endonuclease
MAIPIANIPISDNLSSTLEQRFILPGYHTWQQFKEMQSWVSRLPGMRISYLDGCIELMTTGEEHEFLKKSIAILIEAYLFARGIRFFPVGNATREAEEKGASFQPDESYYIGSKKAHPDLALEVALTSGGIEKLEKYKRFQIAEVWFWQNDRLAIYGWRGEDYERISSSELLPNLDLELLSAWAK